MSTIQDILFRRALKEENIEISGFRTDHATPYNFNNNIKYNFMFPKSFINESENLRNNKKTVDYFFIGTIQGPHRQFLKTWDKPNSVIKTSTENKFIHPNNDPNGYYGDNFFNKEYFEEMSKSKFVLSPAGCSAFDEKYVQTQSFMWSYRFWEAILVNCIPITNEPDPKWHKDYKFYRIEDEHVYREDWVNHNLNLLKERHFIWTKD